jgi:hypothetical protein
LLKQKYYFNDNDALLSPNNVRIFRCAASMGDVVFALGALTALRKQGQRQKIHSYCQSIFEDLIELVRQLIAIGH